MSLASKIALVIIIIISICALCRYLYEKRKQAYFKSKKFSELSRSTDDVLTLYEELKAMSYQLKQFIAVNFSPSSIDEAEMRSFRGDHYKRDPNLPPLTYLCTKEIIQQYKNNPYGLLIKYCGFSNSPIMKQHIDTMIGKADDVYAVSCQFNADYAATLRDVTKELPPFIKLFSKKAVLLMLGLQLEDQWESKIYPAYVFKQIDDDSNTIRIEFNPTELYQISQYLR